MNVPVPGVDGPEVVTQESLLLGAAERISRIRSGRIAVHLFLSRLKPQNRQDGHIRIALRMLEPMVNAYRGQMFLLGNSDIVFMLKDPYATDVENMIYKLRALFSKDPLTFSDSGDGKDNFCAWYDLANGEDYDAFVAMARETTAEARKRIRDKVTARPAPKAMDAKALADVLARLGTMGMSGVIRRQAGIEVTKDSKAVVTYQEIFVSIAELHKALAPDINLMGNRWLFQHLSQTLDQRVLAAMGALPLRTKPAQFDLNLNIATVMSPAFDALAELDLGGTRIAVELQILDILADSRGFYAARQKLKDGGHMMVIDGLNELTLQFMDVTQFGADLYKFIWSPELADSEHGEVVAAAFEPIGSDKLLLARCDSEAAISWGLNRGIQRFQGRYVDSMLAAYTMAGCDKAAACTLQQCTARHAAIGGGLREECGNNDMLDSLPVMVAPKARNRKESSS